jgi:hypothetical protein
VKITLHNNKHETITTKFVFRFKVRLLHALPTKKMKIFIFLCKIYINNYCFKLKSDFKSKYKLCCNCLMLIVMKCNFHQGYDFFIYLFRLIHACQACGQKWIICYKKIIMLYFMPLLDRRFNRKKKKLKSFSIFCC